MSFSRVAIVGLGLLGGSVGLAVAENLPGCTTTGYDADPEVRLRAEARGLVGRVCATAAEAARDAELVIFCVPVGAMEQAAMEIAETLPAGAIVTDV